MIYFELFWNFFHIGLFGFGGGYGILPLIEERVVNVKHWLTFAEYKNLVTISQMTPGPIIINSATFVGVKEAGILGSVVATLGCVLPSVVIVMCLAAFYYKYKDLSAMQDVLAILRPAAVAFISVACVSILGSVLFVGEEVRWDLANFSFAGLAIFLFGLMALRKYKSGYILLLLSCGVVGVVLSFLGLF